MSEMPKAFQIGGIRYKPKSKNLLAWLRYDEGEIYWVKTASSKALAGSRAGWYDKDGYRGMRGYASRNYGEMT